jgi:hypothetical protein
MDGELVAEYGSNAVAASPQKEYGYRNLVVIVLASLAGLTPTLGRPGDPGDICKIPRGDFGEELLAGQGLRTSGVNGWHCIQIFSP